MNASGPETPYTVQLTGAAARELRKLGAPRPVLTSIRDTIASLGANPRPPGAIKLTGVDAWRVRVGDYRVIYEISDAIVLVTVVRIGHRREIYQGR